MKILKVLFTGIIIGMFALSAHADLTSETYKTIFLCDAVETEFDFDFKVFDEDDIEVILVLESTSAETTLVLGSGAGKYTVADLSDSGGTVTTGSTYAATYTLIVRRNQAKKQEIDYVPQGPFSTTVLEQGLDTIVMMVQDNAEKIDRSLLQAGTATTSITFPVASASKVIGWNAAGTGLENVTAPTTITVADTTDTSSYVSLWESATGDLYPKSDGGITYNAGTGMLSVTGITSTLTGNVTGDVTGNADTVSTITGLAPDTATTQAAQASITSLGTLTTLSVDNITINGNDISSTAGTDLTITPLADQQIVLDGTIIIDAGVVTGATSITSTAFAGALTGNATTVTTNANLTGDVTSSGNATDITESVLEDGGSDELAITHGMMNTGTNASATSYWRGDDTWVVPAGAGDLLADGSTPMTSDWDIGNFDITLKSLTSDGTTTIATADINGGAMDGVNIGTTTATGELIVNDASDDANGLGAQGNSGQVLTSAGAGANPTFETPTVYLASVSQGDLNTATGEVSVNKDNQADLTLPGGEYGFYPQVKMVMAAAGLHYCSATIDSGVEDGQINWKQRLFEGTTESYATRIHLATTGPGAGGTYYARQRYITASGHDHWIFLLVDKETKNIISSYQAPDHPSANQGGATEIEIPHPFGSYDPEKHEIVVVDNADLDAMRQRVTRNKSLLQVINEDYVIDDTKRPTYTPREIIKIDEYGDLPGTVIKTLRTPEWAKIMIGSPDFTLKRQMVETLPENIKFRKMKLK